jgi:signal transduction histidine kinase
MGMDEGPPHSALASSRRVTGPVCVLALLVAVLAVTLAGPGQSTEDLAISMVVLLAGEAGVLVVLVRGPRSGNLDLMALGTAGLAGTALALVQPDTPAVILTYVALGGLGMRLPIRPVAAAGTGLVVLAVMNSVAGPTGTSLVALISVDVGMVFVFAVGAFMRTAQIARWQAQTAQARAEQVLIELHAAREAQTQAAALGERARLAREIHDVLAHALPGLILALDTVDLLLRQGQDGPTQRERIREQVHRDQRIARDGLADTRRAIAALRGDELPGPALLEQLVRDTAAATGVRAKLTVAGPARPLPPEIGLTLYRTAQEALTNTAKHAGRGASAQLLLVYQRDAVELAIDDVRAPGIPGANAELTFGGYGLTGMRERAELLGGSLSAGPSAAGFTVRLRLPGAAAEHLSSAQVLVGPGSDPVP